MRIRLLKGSKRFNRLIERSPKIVLNVSYQLCGLLN